ncbi:MAG TPA: chemotaxis protein CheA [Gemmatimonadales bacterium]|nr:chemotaxis protein CheA [Gemmatimonadales bacterium]
MSSDEHVFTELIRDYVAECLPHAERVTDTFVELERCWSDGIPADDLLPGLKGTLHTLKGNSAMMGFTPLQALAHALEDVCARCTADPGARTAEAANLLVEGGSLLIDLIRHAATTPPAPEATADFVARVARLLEATPEGELDRREPERREGDRRQADRRGGATPADASAVRIDFRLLDTMLEIFGESMIDHAALHDAHRRLLQRLGATPELSDLDRTLLSLDSTMKRFENALMRTRMLPVSTVFGRFTRLVRDVARSEGKRVRLAVAGGETLLDKTVLDRLGEPLVHLLTNAIVHGIESEADRVAAGKPAEASLVLRAAPISDRVVITVADNGRGLDLARIQAKAEALGLAPAGADPEQVANLIFRPGFSTTEQVSTLAGRGVGLDVVAQSIRELGGTIEIRNVPGRGVTFILGLPLTLAIVKSLIVEVDRERYAVPLSHVVETARVDPAAIHDIHQQGVTIWRGHPVAVTDGGVLLGSPAGGETDRSFYLVITSGGRRRVILVDRLIGYQDVVVKGLDPALGRPDVVSGAAILGDGRVACILDPVRILDQRSAA